MIDKEERESIILEAQERTLLKIPEIVGNLLIQHVSNMKLREKFYEDHKDFAKRKDLVASIIEKVEGKDPLKKYEDILKEAVPEIQKVMSLSKDLDVMTADRPNSNGEF
jgi:hypothetical protein